MDESSTPRRRGLAHWSMLVLLLVVALAVAATFWQVKRLADAVSQVAAEGKDRPLPAVLPSGGRAWLGPGNARIRGNVAAGSPLVLEMGLRNTGREPAVNLSWTQQRFVSAPNEASAKELATQIAAYVKQCVAAPPKPGQSVLFPTPDTGPGLILPAAFDAKVVDDDVVKGSKLLVVETCVAYETAAQVRHSAFCYFYGAQAGEPLPRLCEIGNYAD